MDQIRWNEKEKENEEKKKEKKRWKKNLIGKQKKEKGRRGKREIFRRSNGRSSTVRELKSIHMWVPKYGSFIKLQEVGNFPTQVISSLKAPFNGLRLSLRSCVAVKLVPKFWDCLG